MSEFTQVPSFPRMAVNRAGQVRGPSGRVLADFPDRDGYRRVNLYEPPRHWRQLAVHALVCETYHGPRPPGAHVAHADGDPANNQAANLRWATPRDNEADKRGHGTDPIGERNPQAVLTEAQVLEIRQRRLAGESGVALAREYGVTDTAICAVHTRRTWRHLP